MSNLDDAVEEFKRKSQDVYKAYLNYGKEMKNVGSNISEFSGTMGTINKRNKPVDKKQNAFTLAICMLLKLIGNRT